MKNNILIPEADGITHINIYSKGNTQLGQMLSNFYKYPIATKDGSFMSVEGYWYWLSIEDCPEKEQLRKLHGYLAKKIGKEILETKERRFDENFEDKIKRAIWYKFKRNAHMLEEKYQNLPFEHYYNFGGKLHDVKNNYPWMMEAIEKMRLYIIEKRKES